MELTLQVLKLVSLAAYLMLLDTTYAEKCQIKDGKTFLTLSGRVFSSESSCREPFAGAEIRLYLGCGNSNSFELEPFSGGKTGTDGAFEVSVPIQMEENAVSLEICLAPRRSCRPLTLKIPKQKISHDSITNHQKSGESSAKSSYVFGHVIKSESKDFEARVDVCLSEKKRRKRTTSWDDRDMNWLKKRSQDDTDTEVENSIPGKRGWSNGVPWLKRMRFSAKSYPEKKLWEGADEEVGWIKRNEDPDDKDDHISNALSEYPEGSTSVKSGERQLNALSRRPMITLYPWNTKRTGFGKHHWPQSEEMKKYWAESDMSWL